MEAVKRVESYHGVTCTIPTFAMPRDTTSWPKNGAYHNCELIQNIIHAIAGSDDFDIERVEPQTIDSVHTSPCFVLLPSKSLKLNDHSGSLNSGCFPIFSRTKELLTNPRNNRSFLSIINSHHGTIYQ